MQPPGKPHLASRRSPPPLPGPCYHPPQRPLTDNQCKPYLAMGSLQWSRRLSPPFPFALRGWPPSPRHLLSLQPGKGWLAFRQCPKDLIPAATARFPPTVLTLTLCRFSLLPQAQRILPCIPNVGLSCGAFLWTGSVLTEHATPGGRDGGPHFLSSSLSYPQLSRNPTHGIPRPARPSAQPGLVLSRSRWLPTQPEGGRAAGGATSPRKPHRANDCRGPGEARPARSRSHGQSRGHKLSVCSQRHQSPKVPGHECPPLDSGPWPMEKSSHPGSAWRAGLDPQPAREGPQLRVASAAASTVPVGGSRDAHHSHAPLAHNLSSLYGSSSIPSLLPTN